VLEQAQSVKRGETPTGGVTGKRVRRPPEHRQPGVQPGSRRAHLLGHVEQRHRVRRPDRVGEDQRHVDVADQRAEAAVRETAQGVGREQPSTEGLPTDAHRVGENILTRGAPRVGLGPHCPVRAVVVAQAAKIPVHRRPRCSRSVGTAGSVLARPLPDNHSFVDVRQCPPPICGWNLPAAGRHGRGDTALRPELHERRAVAAPAGGRRRVGQDGRGGWLRRRLGLDQDPDVPGALLRDTSPGRH
jgi:hypothetical protein